MSNNYLSFTAIEFLLPKAWGDIINHNHTTMVMIELKNSLLDPKICSYQTLNNGTLLISRFLTTILIQVRSWSESYLKLVR